MVISAVEVTQDEVSAVFKNRKVLNDVSFIGALQIAPQHVQVFVRKIDSVHEAVDHGLFWSAGEWFEDHLGLEAGEEASFDSVTTIVDEDWLGFSALLIELLSLFPINVFEIGVPVGKYVDSL